MTCEKGFGPFHRRSPPPSTHWGSASMASAPHLEFLMFTFDLVIAVLNFMHTRRRSTQGLPSSLALRAFGDIPVPALGQSLQMIVGVYARIGGPVSIRLLHRGDVETGYFSEPYADLTRPPGAFPLLGGHVLVQYHDLPSQAVDALLSSGYFADVGVSVPSGYCQLHVWQLTDKFFTEFAAAHKAEIEAARVEHLLAA